MRPNPTLANTAEYAMVGRAQEVGMEKARYLEETYTVRFYEVDTQRRVTVPTICNYLQEMADNHAFILGFAVDQVLPKGLTWVLSRLHLRMKTYPCWRETLRIATWPSEVRKLFAFRDYKLLNAQKEEIGHATSDWLLLDLNTMKPILIPDSIQQNRATEHGRVFVAPTIKLPELDRVEHEKIFQVRQSDLDINQHVNNVSYIEWALETAPEEVRQTHQLTELQVVFRAAGQYGDEVVSQSRLLEEGPHKAYLHRLQRKGDGKKMTDVKSIWAPTGITT